MKNTKNTKAPPRLHITTPDEPAANRPPRGRGRPKGAKNKVSGAVVQQILDTLDELDALTEEDGTLKYPGGYLMWLAEHQPKAFATLLGRCLPRDVNLTGSVTMTFDQALTDLEAVAKLVG